MKDKLEKLNKRQTDAVIMAQIVDGINSKLPNTGYMHQDMEHIYLEIQPYLKMFRFLLGDYILSDFDEFGRTISFPFGAVIGELLKSDKTDFLGNPITMRAMIIKISEAHYFAFDTNQGDDDDIVQAIEDVMPFI